MIVDSGQQTGRSRTKLPKEQSPKMSYLEGGKSANVRVCPTPRYKVVNAECLTRRNFSRQVMVRDESRFRVFGFQTMD